MLWAPIEHAPGPCELSLAHFMVTPPHVAGAVVGPAVPQVLHVPNYQAAILGTISTRQVQSRHSCRSNPFRRPWPQPDDRHTHSPLTLREGRWAGERRAISGYRTRRVRSLPPVGVSDTRTGGMAGELAATISESVFEYLDAPIVRVTAPDTPVPYSPPLEEAFLPNAEKVIEKARWLFRY